MSTLYDSILSLCEECGITGGKMCVDIGLSKSLMSGLKSGKKSGINAETAQKIADYFGVSVGSVLGTEQKEKPLAGGEGLTEVQMMALEKARQLSDEDILRWIKMADVMFGEQG